MSKVLVKTAEGLLAQWRPAQAVPLLRRSVAIEERVEGDPNDLARARFLLARALLESREDEPGALAMARAALDAYARAPHPEPAPQAEVERWLGWRASNR